MKRDWSEITGMILVCWFGGLVAIIISLWMLMAVKWSVHALFLGCSCP